MSSGTVTAVRRTARSRRRSPSGPTPASVRSTHRRTTRSTWSAVTSPAAPPYTSRLPSAAPPKGSDDRLACRPGEQRSLAQAVLDSLLGVRCGELLGRAAAVGVQDGTPGLQLSRRERLGAA